VGEQTVQVGISVGNVLNGNAPPELVRQLLEARLQSELRHKSTVGISETEIARDWNFLQKASGNSDLIRTARTTPHGESVRGNKP
jgi:hypothetical protein